MNKDEPFYDNEKQDNNSGSSGIGCSGAQFVRCARLSSVYERIGRREREWVEHLGGVDRCPV